MSAKMSSQISSRIKAHIKVKHKILIALKTYEVCLASKFADKAQTPLVSTCCGFVVQLVHNNPQQIETSGA